MRRRIRSLLVALAAGAALVATAASRQAARPEPEPAADRLAALRDDAPWFWKGNLHTHSFWSDGDDFPEMVAD